MVFNLVNMIKKTFIIRMFFFNFLLKFKNKWVLFIQRLDDGMLRFKKKNKIKTQNSFFNQFQYPT